MINFTDRELLQLQFCMNETKKMMCHPSEYESHAAITSKVKDEMQLRTEKRKAFTKEGVMQQLEQLIKQIEKND
mgnify:CR=1 FL=1